MAIRFTTDCVVVLAGPSGSGKSTWAKRWFRPDQIVSSDALRAVVGTSENDLRASSDAFAVLDQVVERRLKRGLLTVIDTLGFDDDNRERWRELAKKHKRPVHLVAFDETDRVCRSRNKARARPVPSKVLTAQLKRWTELRPTLDHEGYVAVHEPDEARISSRVFAGLEPTNAGDRPALSFGLVVGSFQYPGETDEIASRLADIAGEAEEAGFTSLWVLDHLIQIPQSGRRWEPMLESTALLGYLAARTSTIKLGTLVTNIALRPIGLVGKIVATLDVLSNGRAMCGIGIGGYEDELLAHGYDLETTSERYDLLRDAMEFLPLLWRSGAPAFDGRRITSPEAYSYPRPLQEKIPILVGGGGEKVTLRIVAQYADAANFFGSPEQVAHKIQVLRDHCESVGRDPSEIEITHMGDALCAPDQRSLDARVAEVVHDQDAADGFLDRLRGGTPADHIDRYGSYAAVGVQSCYVSINDLGHSDAVRNFAPVIEAFS